MDILSQFINGLGLGSIYALVALGYSMVYGIVKLINFAHGDIIMINAYILFTLLKTMNVPVIPAILLTVAFGVLSGILIEKLAYDHLIKKDAPRISLLITAIGVSIFLQNLFQNIYGSSSYQFPSFFPTGSMSLGSIKVDYVTLIVIVVSLILLLLLQLLVQKSKMGKAMRATSEDPAAAKLMGINSTTVIMFTFALGSGLAAIASIFYGASYSSITPYMGGLFGLKAFVAAVLGGIGSIHGAMVGGIALGIVETYVKSVNVLNPYSDAVVFGILIIVLIFKPSGIFGTAVREKV